MKVSIDNNFQHFKMRQVFWISLKAVDPCSKLGTTKNCFGLCFGRVKKYLALFKLLENLVTLIWRGKRPGGRKKQLIGEFETFLVCFCSSGRLSLTEIFRRIELLCFLTSKLLIFKLVSLFKILRQPLFGVDIVLPRAFSSLIRKP